MALAATSARWAGAFSIALAVASPASAANESKSLESAIQYALEKLPSGVTSQQNVGGAQIAITPLRTWKSVSGHYCREYEEQVLNADAPVRKRRRVRCRSASGEWKLVEAD